MFDEESDAIAGEDSWQDIHLGADVPSHAARIVTKEGPGGTHLHGYLKFQLAGGQTYLLTMNVDLRPIEAEVNAELAARGIPNGGAASGGRIARKIKGRLKKAVKKIASNKLVKGLVSVAKKVVNNPLVKGMIAAVPGGAAVLAVQAAAKVAAKAIRGGKKAKAFVANVARRVRSGDKSALPVARLLKQGIKASGIAAHLRLPANAAAAGEDHYLSAVLGACSGNDFDPYAMSAGGHYLVGIGADESDGTEEIDAVETVATSGAFEGVRWLASRMSLHSMAARGDEFTARGALMLGHQLMAQPRR